MLLAQPLHQAGERHSSAGRAAKTWKGIDIHDDWPPPGEQQINSIKAQAENPANLQGNLHPLARKLLRGNVNISFGCAIFQRCGATRREKLAVNHPELSIPAITSGKLLQDNRLLATV